MSASRRIIVEDAGPDADEPEKEEPDQDEPEKPEPKKPAPPKQKKSEPVNEDTEDPYVECPECDAQIKRERLGNHMWKAHKVDRRTTDRDKKDGSVDLEPPDKVTPKDQAKATGKPKKKTAVSRGWFGDRAE